MPLPSAALCVLVKTRGAVASMMSVGSRGNRRQRLGSNPAVSSCYRLTDHHGRDVVECSSIDFLKGMIRHLPPGRYAVDQILTWSPASESTDKRWGTIVKLDDDRIIEEPKLWDHLSEPPCPTASPTSHTAAR
jgi:hypothetical protein